MSLTETFRTLELCELTADDELGELPLEPELEDPPLDDMLLDIVEFEEDPHLGRSISSVFLVARTSCPVRRLHLQLASLRARASQLARSKLDCRILLLPLHLLRPLGRRIPEHRRQSRCCLYRL